jgi:hypothetical protein
MEVPRGPGTGQQQWLTGDESRAMYLGTRECVCVCARFITSLLASYKGIVL